MAGDIDSFFWHCQRVFDCLLIHQIYPGLSRRHLEDDDDAAYTSSSRLWQTCGYLDDN
jgi:hypothetical protein